MLGARKGGEDSSAQMAKRMNEASRETLQRIIRIKVKKYEVPIKEL